LELHVPEDGELKRPEIPTPGEYEKLRKAAADLREVPTVKSQQEQEKRSVSLDSTQRYLRYTGIGLQFLVIMGLPLGLGFFADGWLGTLPAFILTGAVLGIVAAMVFVVREVLRMEGPSTKH